MALGRIKGLVDKAKRIFVVPAWIIRGREVSSGEPLTVVYAGVERHKNYFARMVFGDQHETVFLGELPPSDVRHRSAAAGPETSLVVYEGPEDGGFFGLPGFFRMPVWIETEYDLSEDIETLRKKSDFRDIRSRIRNHGMELEVSDDRAFFGEFYDKMYLPYTRKSHGNTAFLYEEDYLKKQFEQGEFIVAKKEGTTIGALLIYYDKGEATLGSFGVREGDMAYLQQGLVGAMIYRSILRVKEKGHAKACLGYSRGFLRDGALRFKARIGAAVTPRCHPQSGFLRYQFLKDTPALRSFLMQNPFIHKEDDGRLQAVMFAATAPLDCEALSKDRYCRGLRGLRVYAFEGDTEKPAVNAAYPAEIQPATRLWEAAR